MDSRFIAWELGASAVEAEGAERESRWDAMFDAYEAIAESPIDPGNDESPFWAVARHLPLDRTRRALALLRRMASHPLGMPRTAQSGAWPRLDPILRHLIGNRFPIHPDPNGSSPLSVF